jgi:hypothetical protein
VPTQFRGDTLFNDTRRSSDARQAEFDELAVSPLHGRIARDPALSCRRQVEAAQLMATTVRIGRRSMMKLRKTIYALASMAALAMAIGAAWKPK